MFDVDADASPPPAPTCTDGMLNGNETDVDCGGTKCPACADGMKCKAGADCVDLVCNATCQAPSCTDKVQNGAETAVDCGGGSCPGCDVGAPCKTGTDCASGLCSVMSVCLVAPCADKMQDGDETDIDCGGSCTTKCGVGAGCKSNADCNNLICDVGNTNACLPPTSSDGLQNGTETDVDCGGGAPTNAPPCALGQKCGTDDASCTTGACNYAGKCVELASCKGQHGGDTCGPAGATESCCISLPAAGLPASAVATTTIDKYNITAGRFRAFVNATGGDFQTWINTHTPAWWDPTWTKFLPATMDNGSYGSPVIGSSLYEWMGPYVYAPGAMGTNEGCNVKGVGARSFRLPDGINASFGDEQDYTIDFDDERPLNCVTAYIIAAFCAWDGGHMPTRQQIDYLWSNGTTPWAGGAPAGGYYIAYGADPRGTFGTEYFTNGTSKPAPFTPDLHANWGYNYWGGVTVNKTDYTIYIAPPGRFPLGNGPYGHADLGGNVFNATDINGVAGQSCNFFANSAPCVYWSRSGSWQGHGIPYTSAGSWIDLPATNKYWALGGRCAR
jgi:formylglycine-generating enzyme required for sulfatase activity